jgi:pilus assembly protein CpaB
MFNRFLVVGLASLALACGIALVCNKLLGSSEYKRKVPTRNVVVATTDLAAGTKIRPQDIRTVGVPEELAPQNCFQKMEDVKDRVVTNLIMKDEPVIPNRLASPGTGPGLAPMIPAGYRAVAVRVNDVIGVAGFIQPGMRVDVLASGRLPNSEDSVTRTVLQNVVVLSAGQVLQPEPKGEVINAQVVTLQVRPDEAEILTLTSGEGRIQLVLRNSSDTAVGSTPGARLTAVYNGGTGITPPAVIRHFERAVPSASKTPVPIEPSVPRLVPPRAIEVIRGTTRSDAALPDVAGPKETGKNNEPDKKKVTRRLYEPYKFA